MISLGAHVPGNLSPPGDKSQAATGKRLAVQHGSQAVAGQRGKVGNFLRLEAQVLSPLYHGMGQGMLAFLLQGIGGGDQLFIRYAGSRQYVGHTGLAGGDGAGFIQRHHAHLSCFLQRYGGFEKNAVFGSLAVAHHDGYRRGQPQRARAADDQH